MLEIQAIAPSYPVLKPKKIHKDEYRSPNSNKPHRHHLRLEEHEEKLDESIPSQHIDERV